MVPLGFRMFAIVTGGIGLGTVVAKHVDPVPKQPEPQPWQLSARPQMALDSEAGILIERPPGDTFIPSGYAPDWADDPTVWEYRVPEIAVWEPAPSVFELDARIEEGVTVTYGSHGAIEEAASDAAAAADEAEETAASDAPLAPGDTRKPQLADAGLY